MNDGLDQVRVADRRLRIGGHKLTAPGGTARHYALPFRQAQRAKTASHAALLRGFTKVPGILKSESDSNGWI
jgi:hypothetical protein